MSTIKVCDCFFDVAVYCEMVESPYRDFFNYCMNENHDNYVTTRKDTRFIACCKDFLKTLIKKNGLNKIETTLASNCFYSSGINSGYEDEVVSCINTHFDEQNLDYYCFICQRNILDSFSDELHYIDSNVVNCF